jgi:enamine deaminase RidA (YjgF/YER057c/UK114 family)
VREKFREGAGFEERMGYARAVRHGSRIAVSGTGDLAGDGTIGHPGDPEGQARAALERAVAAVERLGGRREDVIRTRILIKDGVDWTGIVRAHREVLDGVEPANTTYFVAGFPAEGMLVEVELEAEVVD